MFRVVSCLVVEHDWRLVVLAGIVCFLTSLVALNLFRRATSTSGRSRAWWLVTTSAATGVGIWSTHFIAMLAYTPGMPVGYDVVLTLVSLVAAALVTGIGFAAVVYGSSRWRAPTGGFIVGFGIACMHYTGMWALEIPGHVEWHAGLVLASIVLGGLFGMAALDLAARADTVPLMLVSAVLLTLAIVSHHFTAMGAVAIVPDSTVASTALSLSPGALAMTIASAALAVLGVSLVSALAGSARQQLIAKSQAEITEQVERLTAALTNMSQGLCMFDRDQRLVVSNKQYAEVYSIAPERLRPGMTLREILQERVAAGSYYGDANTHVENRMAAAHDTQRSDSIVELKNGRAIHVVRQPLKTGGWLATHEDVTERRQMEAKVAHMARHDALTSLPNRVLFREKLDEALLSIPCGKRVAVHCLDLDLFKSVNDTLGHPIGDALLRAVTKRLLQLIRTDDLVSRQGGDEFAIIQCVEDARADAMALAERIIDSLSSPYDIDAHQIIVGVSIGVAIAPYDGVEPDELLKNADLALYRAKADGRGTFRFFEAEMDTRLQERRRLELDLRKALAAGEFELHYQPLLNLRSNRVTGCEALIRWRHPERGLVGPSDFISVLEETALIASVGEWILREACREAATWPDQIKVAVNLSPVQFRSLDLVAAVGNALADAGLPPNRLELEITESVLLQDCEATLATLHKLRELGVMIAMDDFGTGYSSLSYLQKFPFDKIKIDRSFISNLTEAKGSAAIVRAVATLGASLGMTTTAEGVENQDQLEQLRAEGCIEVQGYYFSPPRPAHELVAILNDTRDVMAAA